METKINMYYIQKGDRKIKCYYTINENSIEISAKRYGDYFYDMFEGVENQNCTDSMTDYFEKSRIEIPSDHKDYEAIKKQVTVIKSKFKAKYQKQIARHKAKWELRNSQ